MKWKEWAGFTGWMFGSFIISHWVVFDAFHLAGLFGTLANWGLAGFLTLWGWNKYIKNAVKKV